MGRSPLFVVYEPPLKEEGDRRKAVEEFLHEIFFLISQKNPSVTCSDSFPTGEPNLQRQQQKPLPIFFPQNACNFHRNIVQ